MTVKFLALSDTHTHSLKKIIKDQTADILLIAGDITYQGTLKEMKQFESFLREVRPQFKHSVFIGGNHEVQVARDFPHMFEEIAKETDSFYLENSSVTLEGIKIWGSPVTPTFGRGWAFNVDRGEPIRKIWEQIPLDTDVLMTHGMPYMRSDTVLEYSSHEIEHVGCKDLADRIKIVKPKIVLGGHLHRDINEEGRYTESCDEHTTYFNVSICDDSYNAANPPVMFEV